MVARLLWLSVLMAMLTACGTTGSVQVAESVSDDVIKAAVNATSTALATLAPPATAVPTATLAPATAVPTRPLVVTPAPTANTGAAGGGATAVTGATAVAGVPIVTPGGTASVPLTADEATYVRGVTPVIREYNRSFDRFRELLDRADASDPAWRMSLSAELSLWLNGADAARAIRAPQSLATVHQRVMAGLDLYQQAARQLVQAIDAADEEQVRQGLTRVTEARQAFDDAERELGRIARQRGL